jgi:hypothetical protein
MRWWLSDSLLVIALLACSPGGGGGEPAIVWKGVICGPGPIAPTPGLGSGLGPVTSDPLTVRSRPREPAPPRPAPPACGPLPDSRETVPRP